MSRLPITFGSILAGAIIIEYGVRNIRTAFSNNALAPTNPPPGKLDTTTGLNANQQAFAKRLNANTGLDPSVISAWLLSEEPASTQTAPNGPNNWLNIGSFSDHAWHYGNSSVWANPITAADATASFILGHPVNGITAPSYGSLSIRRIVMSISGGVRAQARAIINSDWAASHYPTGPLATLAQ
jgi:hypothetical protein